MVALALVAAGCSSSAKSAAPPTSTTQPTPTTAIPDAQPIASGEGQVIAGTATGDSPCEKAAPTPASPGELGTGGGGSVRASVIAGEHGARGMVKQEPLTHAQRVELQQQMAEARTAAAAVPDGRGAPKRRVTSARRCTCRASARTTPMSALAIGFDPSHPSELLYDGSTPDAKIVGLSYLVYHHNGPPPGFAGDNDHWHQHNANGGLCLKGGEVVGGEETSRAECAARGGHKTLLIDIWMLHAWVVPGFECSWGVFSGECPELGGRIGGTAFDPPAPS